MVMVMVMMMIIISIIIIITRSIIITTLAKLDWQWLAVLSVLSEPRLRDQDYLQWVPAGGLNPSMAA